VCARTRIGAVWCWGDNRETQVADTPDDRILRPRLVEGLDGVAQVACGDDYTCARRRDGTVWCWGSGENGALGLGDRSHRARPTRVTF
jgi:alpha-tubulin suppressor-like RCC1 family protein